MASLLERTAALRAEVVRLGARAAELEARKPNLLGDDDTVLQSGSRIDALVANLSATAERLARTEEELARARADAAAQEGERDRKTSNVESLLGQLTDRDLRIAALERRREEELSAVQRSLTLESQANRTLRTSLDAVRSGLSAILVDGRGAMVAHDLMALLRRIEDA